MLFSSPVFLFLFLPIVLAGYWLVGCRLRNPLLLGASLIFYVWGDISFILLLLASILVNYTLGILADKHRDTTKGKLVICATLILNIGVLFWYKYANFFADILRLPLAKFGFHLQLLEKQHLPLGISFFTFQAIAYVIDIYREQFKPQRNLPCFAMFMALFPKLAAGPIIRYSEVEADIMCRYFNRDQFSEGINRFVVGLGKKVLIADTLAKTSDLVFSIPSQELPAAVAWLGIACYTLQIYFDFSGYSDMAIGLGRMLGFRFQENFNYPYIARSLTDFWRRWHISLSTWLRDYLFMPLGYALMTSLIRRKIAHGNYRINYRILLSTLIVFTLCGLWHGAGFNYIAWGALHGLIMVVESLWLARVLKKLWIPLQHAYLITVVTLSWVLFRCTGIESCLAYLKALFGLGTGDGIKYHLTLYLDNELLLVMLVAIIGVTPVIKGYRLVIEGSGFSRFAPVVEIVILLLILAASFASLASSTFSPFIYQQF